MSALVSPLSKRPIVLIIHGSWHTPSHYHPLIHALTASDFATICPPLPSCSNERPLTTGLDEDIAFVRATALDLAAHGHPIIALMHSYGGVVGTQALVGLSHNKRASQQQPGGVVALVYMAAFMLPVGASLSTVFDGQVPSIVRPFDDGTCAMDDPWLRLYSTDVETPPKNYTFDVDKLSSQDTIMGWPIAPYPGPPATSERNSAIPKVSADNAHGDADSSVDVLHENAHYSSCVRFAGHACDVFDL